ncbi:hypothetical protein BLA29_012845 [Euroglyphus maynei]|uniref:Uncharacterized protein n=1 Tax=Euroglyphus maynei TaxID=6958 RepID=A0A1Y3B9Q5_EURMA|nr:hypothetical protein BLA29_012845 [Euroglyphus maynei]
MKVKQPCTLPGLGNYALIGGSNDFPDYKFLRKFGLEYCLPYPKLPLDFLVVECDVATIRLQSQMNRINWLNIKFSLSPKNLPEPRMPFGEYILYLYNCSRPDFGEYFSVINDRYNDTGFHIIPKNYLH